MPSRRSIRLQGYDYSLPGDYFVTICADEMRSVFGRVECGHVRLSPLGEMVFSVWRDIPLHRQGVALDAFVIMPNHLHGIVRLGGLNSSGDSAVRPEGGLAGSEQEIQPISLSVVVQQFKSFTALKYTRGAAEGLWPAHSA